MPTERKTLERIKKLTETVQAPHGTSYGRRLNAVLALGKIEHPAAIAPVARVLRNEDYDLREAAVKSLIKSKQPKAASALINALRHYEEYPDVGIHAVEALGNRRDPAVIPYLIKAATKHPHWDTNSKVAVALGKIGDLKGIPHLVKALKHNSRIANPEMVPRAATQALGKIYRCIRRKKIQGKNVRALQFVWPHFREDEEPYIRHKALQAALRGKIVPENARLYIKELRALRGSLK